MHSKNKPAMTAAERRHVARIKAMPCVVCGEAGPSEAHEIEQGLWYASIPLCSSCHRGTNGLHGQRRMWAVMKISELQALAQRGNIGVQRNDGARHRGGDVDGRNRRGLARIRGRWHSIFKMFLASSARR